MTGKDEEEAARRAEYWRGLKEDYREFLAAHKIEAKGRPWKFVPARLLTLPGLVLYDLEKKGWIESDGAFGYRPK